MNLIDKIGVWFCIIFGVFFAPLLAGALYRGNESAAFFSALGLMFVVLCGGALVWNYVMSRRPGETKMSHNYRETDEECQGCGATAADRKHNKPTEPQGLSNCPHCATDKCCICDMGDDVECGNCDPGETT